MTGSNEWQMLFNVEKCHVIHAGQHNHKYEYSMVGRVLEEVEFFFIEVSDHLSSVQRQPGRQTLSLGSCAGG